MIRIPAASNPYVLSATAALEAVEVISPNRFVWLGQPFDVVQGDRLEDHPPSIRRLMLVRALVSHLYRWYFCPGVPVVPIPWQGSLGPPIMTERFRAALSRANRGRGLVEAGWNLAARNGAEARIERDGLTLRAPLESILSPPREKATVGSSVRVRLPNESLASSPGHYVALGNAPISHVGGRRLRFYWNLDADGAVALISQFSRALNREGVPYWIKALDNPALYDRRDSVLLCIQAEHGRRVIRIAERAIPALRLFLSPGVPAWTKPIAPGLGFAEDPPGGQSFGLHRCHLLAETIAVASERGLRGTRAKVRLLSRRFSDEGIDLNAPYSTRGAPDPPMLHARISIPRRRSVGSSPDGSFAGSIAWSICRRAIWSGGHCTWIETVPSWAGTARVEERSAPLGTDLYSGASGVALFLAEWSRLSGDRAARRTALGAIRGALDGERSRPGTSSDGLYTGWPGTAWIAAEIAAKLHSESLAQSVRRFLRGRVPRIRPSGEYDLLSGSAGTALALLLLRHLLGEGALLDHASRIGRTLLAGARRSKGTSSWDTPGCPRARNLTGLSHGTAGIAHVLLELYRAGGEARFLTGAHRAFAYERLCYDRRAANWPDFRTAAEGTAGRRYRPRFMTGWCHGAPGIALSRIHAIGTLSDRRVRREAVDGLATTRRYLEALLEDRTMSLSLCHGVAGNALVLREGARILESPPPPEDDLVAAARRAIELEWKRSMTESFAARRLPIGLFLGWSGLGYFELREGDPTVCPILLPTAPHDRSARGARDRSFPSRRSRRRGSRRGSARHS